MRWSICRRIEFVFVSVTSWTTESYTLVCGSRLFSWVETYLHPEVAPCAWKHSGTQPVASCLWATELSSPLYFALKDWYYHTFWTLCKELVSRNISILTRWYTVYCTLVTSKCYFCENVLEKLIFTTTHNEVSNTTEWRSWPKWSCGR